MTKVDIYRTFEQAPPFVVKPRLTQEGDPQRFAILRLQPAVYTAHLRQDREEGR